MLPIKEAVFFNKRTGNRIVGVRFDVKRKNTPYQFVDFDGNGCAPSNVIICYADDSDSEDNFTDEEWLVPEVSR